MGETKPLILVCDDTSTDRELVRRYLPNQFGLECAEDYESARAILASRHVYLALVDLFLDEVNGMPLGFEIQDEFPHVPIVLMSGQNPDRVERAMLRRNHTRNGWLSKDHDLHDQPSLEETLRKCLRLHYNTDLTFQFKKNSIRWESIALKLAGDNQDLHDQFLLEARHLAEKAFLGWDVSDHEHVRAARIDVLDELESGSHSCVLLLRPYTARNEAQADVIFKISRIATHQSSEHRKFDEFKNIVGGFGLRERRYALTCHLQGQVYSVPYHSFEETQTFADLYKSLNGGAEDEAALEALTHYLFGNTLRPLNRLLRTAQQNAIMLSEYYAGRIQSERRAQAIQRDLCAENALPHMRVKRDTLEVRVNGQVRELLHPAQRVLVKRQYKHVDEKVPAAIRHGDFHASNVLVDAYRKMCWFIDYERFDTSHYTLVDHAEFEGSILFSLMNIGEMDAGFIVRFIESISQPIVNQFADMAGAEASPKDRMEAGKAMSAIRAIRASVNEVNGLDAARSYYHALVYEALRVAGRTEANARRRWHALLAAAVLLERVEQA